MIYHNYDLFLRSLFNKQILDLLKELEKDDTATNDLRSLVRFVKPHQFRIGLSEFYLNHLLNRAKPGDSDQQLIFSYVYSLLKFLEDLEPEQTQPPTLTKSSI